jgi:hypothetical protein
MRFKRLPILYSIPELSRLLGHPESLFRRVVVNKGHPACWIWRKRWTGPRWPESALREWREILHEVDTDSLPPDPGYLEHPRGVFGMPAPNEEELAIARRLCGLK